MSEEEILGGNKLIAEFMGYQILHKNYQTRVWCSSNESTWEVTEDDIVCDSNGNEVDDETQEPYFELECLPFYTSWDWLMPVWNKILKWGQGEFGINWEQSIDEMFITIGTTKDNQFIIKWLNTGEIEEVFYVVVEFIKWYNLQK